MDKMSIESISGYENVSPVGNYVLCEVVDKATEVKRGKLYVPTASFTDLRPYLLVVKVSKDYTGTPLSPKDIVEIDQRKAGQLSYFYGKNQEQYVLIHGEYIAGVYKKSKVKASVPETEVQAS